ncbi:MAG: DNA replication protein DnaC [Salinibacterium sp.]|nr:MAG: DNA replication protein DnaC [Salinibacterium sp.]
MDDTALDRITGDPHTASLYAAVGELLDELGPHEIEAKKTSLHVTHGRAFLGVHPRKGALLLNIVLTEPLAGPRVHKVEQVSANRWHNEVIVREISDLDAELREWMTAAYALTA